LGRAATKPGRLAVRSAAIQFHRNAGGRYTGLPSKMLLRFSAGGMRPSLTLAGTLAVLRAPAMRPSRDGTDRAWLLFVPPTAVEPCATTLTAAPWAPCVPVGALVSVVVGRVVVVAGSAAGDGATRPRCRG
jgi:hypothetical protein